MGACCLQTGPPYSLSVLDIRRGVGFPGYLWFRQPGFGSGAGEMRLAPDVWVKAEAPGARTPEVLWDRGGAA
jgi:hypothetical protein